MFLRAPGHSSFSTPLQHSLLPEGFAEVLACVGFVFGFLLRCLHCMFVYAVKALNCFINFEQFFNCVTIELFSGGGTELGNYAHRGVSVAFVFVRHEFQ